MAKDLERIGRAERDITIDLLREHYAAERLTLEEFQERMSKAAEAKTAGDLKLLLVNLPKLADRKPVKKKQEPARRSGGIPVGTVLWWVFIIAVWIAILSSIFRAR